MTKVIMHGCNGKMGQVITGIVAADNKIEIVAGVDQFQGIQNTYPVFDSIERCDVEADVVIDFSNAAAVDGLLDYCVSRHLPVRTLHNRTFGYTTGKSGAGSRADGSFKVGEYVYGHQFADEIIKRCCKSACTGRIRYGTG